MHDVWESSRPNVLYTLQTSADCDKIWFTMSVINLQQSNVNAYNLTSTLLFQKSVMFCENSSATNNSQQIFTFCQSLQTVAKICSYIKYFMERSQQTTINYKVCKHYVMIIILLLSYLIFMLNRMLSIR